MRQTHNYTVDFLDFDPDGKGNERLWRACKPTVITTAANGDLLVTVPFQAQKQTTEIAADTTIPRKEYILRLRAYGDKILRFSIGIDEEVAEESLMLELDPALTINPLSYKIKGDTWVVSDSKGVKKAVFDLSNPVLDHWSDLLPAPDETLNVVFYPDGKKAVLISAYDQFQPARHDAMALAFVEKEGVADRMTTAFHAEADEIFCGTGERFAKLDLSGKTLQLENQDGQGVNSRRTYKNIPFYLSGKGYGAFLHTSAYTKLSLADISTRSVQWMVEQPCVDLFLIGGDSPEEILRGYRQLTGFPTMPPLWSFGTWMSRMTYFSADEVETICNRLRREDYPCDVIHLDTGWFKTDWLCEWKFNDERFPDPEGFIKGLKDNGFRVSLWQLPYIAFAAEQLKEAVDNNYICKVQGERATDGSNFGALDYAGTIDFTYPAAVEWYKGLLKKLLDMGVVCIKTDFGEDIHLDADYHSMAPKLLHNLYSLLYQKAAYEITKEVVGDGIVWARAGWAGCQRYPLHWGGDAACSWDGLAGSLKGGLHLGLSGFGFWSHDVPGFHSVPDFMNSMISDELYVRWTQFGVFSSHLRYHGTSKREPYEFPNISGIVRKWLKLRYALIPYLLEQSKKTTETGYPVLRALIFHHLDDKMCQHIDDQYYFGDDIMVAPVMNDHNRRDIYLPKGQWVNLFTGKFYEGGHWLHNYECPLDEMPVWVKAGAKLSVYPEAVSCTDDMDMAKVIKVKMDESFHGIFKSLSYLEK